MSSRVTWATGLRVLWQIRRDPRTIALLLVVPVGLLVLLKYVFAGEPAVFKKIGVPLCGLFPFIVMFLITSISMLRERTTGTLERLMTLPMTRLDLLHNVNLRDVLGEKLSQIEPAELLRMALADQERTLKLLRAADASSMRRTATQENGEPISAEEVARLPLVNHLEMHLDQLERALRA